MLSRENNERLVRVGPGTEMGGLMRLFWLPFFRGADLPVDGPPHKVRLLGENLLVFRDSAGKPGLVDEECPHRGAPLLYARNEEGGLRCVYHGWKFDVSGRCLEMPAEPADSGYAEKVRLKSRPCVERQGVLWAYLGPGTPPELPHLEWNLVPAEQIHLSFRVQDCNWLQALEGEVDSAHAAILHGRVDQGGVINDWKQARDLRPSFECETHDGGVRIAARRRASDSTNYWRVNQFLLPFYTLVPPFSGFPDLSGHAWVPIDDEHTLSIMFSYHPSEPLPEKTRRIYGEGHRGRETAHASASVFEPRPITVPFHRYWPRLHRDNAYGLDHEAQRATWFSGVPGLWVQDAACQSGVTPIYDRSREHLGVTDTGVVQTRKLLLELLRQLREAGQAPVVVARSSALMERAVSLTLPSTEHPFREGARFMRAIPGEGLGYTP